MTPPADSPRPRGIPPSPTGRRPPSTDDPGGHSGAPLWQRQLPLLLLVAASLLGALLASSLLRAVLFPLIWNPPFYLNPLVTLTLIIYVGLGLILLSGPGDQGWPFYLLLIGIWVFIIAFEFSIVQWFLIQGGVLASGPTINPFIFTACAGAVGAAIVLHTNQLARRLRNDLRERGIDPAELQHLEKEAGRESRTLVIQLIAFIFLASLVLWVAGLIVGTTRLGLDVLGILAGLLIVSGLLAYSYKVLQAGPLTDTPTHGELGELKSPYQGPGHKPPAPRSDLRSAHAPRTPTQGPSPGDGTTRADTQREDPQR